MHKASNQPLHLHYTILSHRFSNYPIYCYCGVTTKHVAASLTTIDKTTTIPHLLLCCKSCLAAYNLFQICNSSHCLKLWKLKAIPPYVNLAYINPLTHICTIFNLTHSNIQYFTLPPLVRTDSVWTLGLLGLSE